MKMKISEMFEYASVNTDAIQLKEDSDIDKDRVSNWSCVKSVTNKRRDRINSPSKQRKSP